MSAFELWWNNVGSSISGVCKEDARHGWDAAIKSMEAQPQADNSAMQVSPKPCPTCRGIGVLMDINLGRQKPCGACGGTGTASA